MLKKLFIAIPIVTLTLVLTPACTEQDKEALAGATLATEQPAPVAEAEIAEAETGDGQVSVMDIPVDFSTPENVEKSIEKVRQQAGKAQAIRLTRTMGHIRAHDPDIDGDKEKLYKKLDGLTPNAIIALMKR